MKRFLLISIFVALACGPNTPTQPFIKVTLLSPEGFPAPKIDQVQVTTSAVINGAPISNTNEAELIKDVLPTDFVVLFSEPVRDNVVNFDIHGFSGGVDVFSVQTSAIAGTTEVEIIVSFCGDQATDPNRLEECDDGATNSDTQPNACRTNCLAASCGDGIIDTEEQCDDSDQNSDTSPDSCRTSCQLPQCGDGVIDSGEICDDANIINNDGCDDDCAPTAVVQLTAGTEHTCALLHSGSVRCWGKGLDGRLGYGNEDDIGDDEFPVVAGDINIGGRASQISAGGGNTCALLDTGKVRCWGEGTLGALGYGNTLNIGDNETPSVAGDIDVGGTVIQISTGGGHTCALLDNGKVRCWGLGFFGALGYGNTNDIGENESPSFAGDVAVGELVAQIETGNRHTCARLTTNEIRCWGDASVGALGYGNITRIGDNETSASAGNVNIGANVSLLSSGGEHNCVLQIDGKVKCWGDSNDGQLGYGNTNTVGTFETPSAVGTVLFGGSATAISAGDLHTCVLLDTKEVTCWGKNNNGQLGRQSIVNVGDNEIPGISGRVNVAGEVSQVVAGGEHTCALLVNGKVLCWGSNNSGQLGYANTNNTLGDVPANAGEVIIF